MLSMMWALVYTPYEGLSLANQISRKLGIFERKLEGNHSIFHCYSDKQYSQNLAFFQSIKLNTW